jgi:hypothetical protein
MSSLPRPIARVYSLLPLALRDRLRKIKRPLWSMYRERLQRAARGRPFSGPFRGMILGGHYYMPALVGTFELELHPWLERIFATHFAHVIDIGGGTGYYAVGFAMRMPRSRITVFELTAGARQVISDVARLNGVNDRITELAECTPSNLATALGSGESTFVLIDVEGAEKDLLDPAATPALRHATILVETHDVLVPGCRDAIVSRFAATHAIEEVSNRPRSLTDFPVELVPQWRLRFPKFALEAMNEMRGGIQVFMLLTPRAASRT